MMNRSSPSNSIKKFDLEVSKMTVKYFNCQKCTYISFFSSHTSILKKFMEFGGYESLTSFPPNFIKKITHLHRNGQSREYHPL